MSPFLLAATFAACNCLLGQSSHLLLLSQGEGAVVRMEGQSSTPLTKASFLPKDQSISVRPRSGIETLSSGFQFRFGSDTRFTLLEDSIELSEGSIMIRSRKIGNTTVIEAPESKIQLNGVGCYLLEVETNGGLKIVVVLGRLELIDFESSERTSLVPGELLFVMPGGRGLGEKVSVNLEKLLNTSYLVAGFPNNQSFEKSLQSVSIAQGNSIGVTYGAEVGDAKGVDSFEVLPKVELNTSPVPTVSPQTVYTEKEVISGYTIPKENPLYELLGRNPKRMKANVASISVHSTENKTSSEKSIITEVEDENSSSNRPFPSRLLRLGE